MKSEPNKKITALYCRSGGKNDKAIQQQKDKLIKYVKEKGFENDKFYIDNGYSGTSMERPDLKRLLNDVKKREIARVIVTDEARLSRNFALSGKLKQYFRKCRTAYKSLQDFTIEENYWGCDAERCQVCHHQLISCSCGIETVDDNSSNLTLKETQGQQDGF